MNVLVLGGSKGLGRACVQELLKEGHKVYIASRTKPNDIEKEVVYLQVNFKDIASILNLAKKVTNLNIDVLVNNSGGPESKSFDKVEASEFLEEIQSHLISSHEIVKAVTPHMIKTKFGRIINIISVTANNPLPNMIVSNSIRGAMTNWSKTLSKELAVHKITVNNVLPGYTKTERLDEVVGYAAEVKGIKKDDIFNKLLTEIPAARFGEPNELAQMVRFLASKKASYINGQSISIDGGWTPCI